LSEWIRRRCNDVAIDQDMLARLLS